MSLILNKKGHWQMKDLFLWSAYFPSLHLYIHNLCPLHEIKSFSTNERSFHKVLSFWLCIFIQHWWAFKGGGIKKRIKKRKWGERKSSVTWHFSWSSVVILWPRQLFFFSLAGDEVVKRCGFFNCVNLWGMARWKGEQSTWSTCAITPIEGSTVNDSFKTEKNE